MFTETRYERVDFSDAEILEEKLSGITFVDCTFRGADFAANRGMIAVDII